MVAEIAAKQTPVREDVRFLFSTETEAGIAAAERHLTRIRFGGRVPVAAESGRRQREAIVAWWKGEGAARGHLTELSLPVLVANGVTDVMIPAEHSFAIARTAPNEIRAVGPTSKSHLTYRLVVRRNVCAFVAWG
jgi:pimeloyl-ACP methyl ester carboxylesterase